MKVFDRHKDQFHVPTVDQGRSRLLFKPNATPELIIARTTIMYAITGITGQVGGAVARTLLDEGRQVRAVVRDASKGSAWRDRGCEVILVLLHSDFDGLAAAGWL